LDIIAAILKIEALKSLEAFDSQWVSCGLCVRVEHRVVWLNKDPVTGIG
jgi:hypothetical protein